MNRSLSKINTALNDLLKTLYEATRDKRHDWMKEALNRARDKADHLIATAEALVERQHHTLH